MSLLVFCVNCLFTLVKHVELHWICLKDGIEIKMIEIWLPDWIYIFTVSHSLWIYVSVHVHVSQTAFRPEYMLIACWQCLAYEQAVFLPAHLRGHEPTSVKQTSGGSWSASQSLWLHEQVGHTDAVKPGCGRAADPSNNQSLLMGLIYCIFAAGRGLNKSKWPKPTCKPNKPRTRLHSAREMFKRSCIKPESWREDMTDLACFWRALAVTLTTNGQRFSSPEGQVTTWWH